MTEFEKFVARNAEYAEVLMKKLKTAAKPEVSTTEELVEQLNAEKKRSAILYSVVNQMLNRCDEAREELFHLEDKMFKTSKMVGPYKLVLDPEIRSSLLYIADELPDDRDRCDMEDLMAATPEEVNKDWGYSHEEEVEIQEEEAKDATAKRLDILYDNYKRLANSCVRVKNELYELYHSMIHAGTLDEDSSVCLDRCDDILADTTRDAEDMARLMSADDEDVLTRWRDVSDKI